MKKPGISAGFIGLVDLPLDDYQESENCHDNHYKLDEEVKAGVVFPNQRKSSEDDGCNENE